MGEARLLRSRETARSPGVIRDEHDFAAAEKLHFAASFERAPLPAAP